jgi:ABC-type molybdenum transport system ATPase subunit/photorepair protein PhrA
MTDMTQIAESGSAKGPEASEAQPAQGAAPQIPQGGLEVVSIAKSYDKRAVLTDISLSVGRGEVLGLLGPNGAGKTTCFYSTASISPICRCTAARSSASAICRRKPRSSAA